MGVRWIGGLLVTGGTVVAWPCAAATIRVPEDSPNVLAAVDLAVPGDTVLVGPGVWTDAATRTVVAPNGTFQVKSCAFPRGGVVIRGQGAGGTTLDVEGSEGPLACAVTFFARAGQGPLRVESMTLTGARGPQGGQAAVGTYSDGLVIRGCRFEGNDQRFGGAAVGVLYCPLTMEDCDVAANTSEVGVVRVDLTPVRMTRCRFEGNTGHCVTTIYDPGDGPAIFQDCQFVRNRGPGLGTALNLQNAGEYLVERCLFQENVAEASSGAAVRASGSTGTIRFSVFAYDSVYPGSSSGGGVLVQAGSHDVHSNTFVGCHGGVNGGAAFTASFSAVGTFHNNVVTHSTTPAVRYVTGTTIAGSCNLFWENLAGNFGSGGAPSPTDFVADPLFCDFAARDFTVRNDSPCLFPPTPSCAPIGALGVGCGGVAIESASWGRLKAAYRGGSP